ncbi:MAG: hypothetical protein F4060_17755 [Holophagales bacterium]|nr:hypothetical protein [Holophagales bacterium]MYG30826.1 hypothetical protein [Holophagales bacterium]MYI81766.1 hypothetical protein [Holophagales bacterium]
MKRLPLVAPFALALAFVAPALSGLEYLQNAQFRLVWKDESLDRFARPAAWSSDTGVLYFVEDQEEPEALVKVREQDGFWRLELGVTTERQGILYIVHNETEALWAVRTGLAKDVVPRYDGDYPDNAVTCMIPRGAPRNAWRCYWGTALLLKDAWDPEGNIPAKYFEPYAKCQGLFESLVTLGQPQVPTFGGRPDSQCP